MQEIAIQKRWYIVRTFSGHELKVKSFIETESERLGFRENIARVLVPSEKIYEIKEGKKRSRDKTMFPGYILIETLLDQKTKHLIQNTPAVMGFLGGKDKPSPLPNSEIKKYIGTLIDSKGEGDEAVRIEVPFHVGEPVKITNGPFNNFSGFIQEINPDKLKLKVMVSIFGRKTPLELDFNQIEIEK
ncbi:MAG: transcription termination/antitermination protein NusG [Bacteroidetes bacterium]|nr:transcription termination/antitermination protein NusG [Bacteroidota bacterium]